jgi:uncharacterized membrane protein (UPF0127 family)
MSGNRLRCRGVLLGFAVAALAFSAALIDSALANGNPDIVSISTASGVEARFVVEIARTPAERSRGLMHRDRLDAEEGMLFVYEAEQPVTMWMRDTRIPLDMVFIGAEGTIVKIRERAVPFSEEIINSEKPVIAVLEVNGGTVSRYGIEAGDRVILPEGAR